MTVEIGKIYRHFKGKLYQVLCIATHSETGEQLVIYQALYGRFEVFARPLSSFTEMLDRNKYPDSSQIYRFAEISRDAIGAGMVSQPDTSFEKEPEPKRSSEASYSAPAHFDDVQEISDPSTRVAPVLMLFLEAETIEKKLNVLKENMLAIDERTMTNIEASLDVVSDSNNLEDRVHFVMDVLRARSKYENTRLR